MAVTPIRISNHGFRIVQNRRRRDGDPTVRIGAGAECSLSHGDDGRGLPRGWSGGAPVCSSACPLCRDVVVVAFAVHKRVAELLVDWDSESDDGGRDNAMDVVAAASVQSMIATGSRRGCKVMRTCLVSSDH